MREVDIENLYVLTDKEQDKICSYYELYKNQHKSYGFVDCSVVNDNGTGLKNEYRFSSITHDVFNGNTIHTITINQDTNKILLPIKLQSGKTKCVYASLYLPQECKVKGIKIYSIKAIPIHLPEWVQNEIVTDDSTVYKVIDNRICFPLDQVPLRVAYEWEITPIVSIINKQETSTKTDNTNINFLLFPILFLLPTNTYDVERLILCVFLTFLFMLFHGGWILIIIVWLYYGYRKGCC